jgi:hypothetical protein
VALSIASLPMAARRVKLGGTRYSIAAGKTKTIKVKLPRRARRLFKAISGRRLRRIRLRLTVTELGKTVKLKLRLRR